MKLLFLYFWKIDKLRGLSSFRGNEEIVENTRIVVAGSGYVGLSLGVLLSQPHLDTTVTIVDIVEVRVKQINERKSPIKDEWIERFLSSGQLNLTATTDPSAYKDADFIIIAVSALIAVILLVEIRSMLPAAIVLCYAFVTIRMDEITVMDFIIYAGKYFLATQQTYRWR